MKIYTIGRIKNEGEYKNGLEHGKEIIYLDHGNIINIFDKNKKIFSEFIVK